MRSPLHPPARSTAVRGLVGLVAAAALLAGCSSTDTDAGPASPTDAAEPAGTETATDAATSAFPVTFHNAWGDVTVEAAPERVVALGYTDIALARALGATVVGAVQSYGSVSGETEEKNLPYVDPLDADVTWLDPMSISVEQVAALQPDLILANGAFTLDENVYDLLSGVAPVVSYETGLYQASAEDEALRVGAALGRTAEAEALVAASDTAIADVRAEIPALDGGTYLYGQAREGVAVMVVDDTNLTARFMSRLGLVPLPAVAEIDGPGSVPGTVDVSLEQADLFDDAGVLFMTYQGAQLRDQFLTNPIVAGLPIMSERYAPLGIEAATALQAPNVAATAWLLDELRPGLEMIAAHV